MKPFFRRLLHRYRSFRERRRARSDNATIRRQQEQIASLRHDLEERDGKITILTDELKIYVAVTKRHIARVEAETQIEVMRGEKAKG